MGSPFASRHTEIVSLPSDPTESVTIRRLSGRALEQARQASQEASIAALKRMGGADFQRELAALGDATQTAALVAQAQADPLSGLDRYVVLQKGVVAWTYADPPTPDALDDLSEEAADYLARKIVDITLPARDAAARKNGSGSSPVG